MVTPHSNNTEYTLKNGTVINLDNLTKLEIDNLIYSEGDANAIAVYNRLCFLHEIEIDEQ